MGVLSSRAETTSIGPITSITSHRSTTPSGVLRLQSAVSLVPSVPAVRLEDFEAYQPIDPVEYGRS
jgi:hypothetical protein